MTRRRKRDGDSAEALVKFVVGGIILISLAVGGLAGFAKIFLGLLWLGIIGCVVFVVVMLIRKHFRNAPPPRIEGPDANTPATRRSIPGPVANAPMPIRAWTEGMIVERLNRIDWYQFEKLSAEILRGEGWSAERKGGASPDGGVDLVATKGETRVLVQCKHWRSWNVQEKVIREMLGSMTHFGVSAGVIHTLKGWTAPAARFAQEHNIGLCDSADLARRAQMNLSKDVLDRLLLDDTHHCPKCEASMIWRTGDFDPFWGCSRYPRCRAVIREPVVTGVGR